MLQFAAGLVCRFVRVETTGHMIKRSPWSRGAFLVVLIVGVLGLSAEMSAQQAGQAPLPATTPIQNKVANDSGAAAGQPTTDPKVSTRRPNPLDAAQLLDCGKCLRIASAYG